MPDQSAAELAALAKQALKQNRLTEAIELFTRAVAVTPDDSSLHEGLATACVLAKDYESAVAAFTRLAQLRPRDPKPWVNIGAIRNMQQQYLKACDALRKAIQFDPKNTDAFYNLGFAQRNLKQLTTAVSAYKECLRFKPDMFEAHIQLAGVYAEQKQHKKAIEHYEAALKLKPGSKSAQQGLEQVKQFTDNSTIRVNPFGRLVDTTSLKTWDAPQEKVRALTDEERFEDKQWLQLNAEEAGELTERMWTHLTSHVEPAILGVMRILALKSEQKRGLFEAHDDLSQALQHADILFERLQAVHRGLKEHEATMHRLMKD